MRLILKTKVEQSIEKVFEGFDQKLFNALNPPLMPAKLLRFDGSKVGDEVHIELFWSMNWVSLITEQKSSDSEIYFIDKGIQLPFFLRSWEHRHRIIKDTNGGTLIIDDISYLKISFIFSFICIFFYFCFSFSFKYKSSSSSSSSSFKKQNSSDNHISSPKIRKPKRRRSKSKKKQPKDVIKHRKHVSCNYKEFYLPKQFPTLPPEVETGNIEYKVYINK